MFRYVIRQLLGLIPLAFLVSIAAFFLVRLLPGDAATAYMNSANIPLTEESVQSVREELGLDKPVCVQYGKWLLDAVKGNLGYSYQTKRPVTEELWNDFKYTGMLTLAALMWITALSTLFGILSAEYADHFPDMGIRSLTFLGSSIPKFWLGFLLMAFFSLRLKWFPVMGAESWEHLILPSFTLACSYVATYTKLLRNSILEIRKQTFVRYARARGLNRMQTMFFHVIPNALTPVLTTLGLHLGGIMSGSVIVENVFAWPGLGRMCVEAVAARNYPMIQGYILLQAVLFIIANLVSDIACAALNPRIRLKGGEA